jgi:hypothetical protein
MGKQRETQDIKKKKIWKLKQKREVIFAVRATACFNLRRESICCEVVTLTELVPIVESFKNS